MSFKLPTNPELRDAIDVQALADKDFVTLEQAKGAARRTFSSADGIGSVFCQVIRADDRVQLIEFGPRGGWTVRHTFGHTASA